MRSSPIYALTAATSYRPVLVPTRILAMTEAYLAVNFAKALFCGR